MSWCKPNCLIDGTVAFVFVQQVTFWQPSVDSFLRGILHKISGISGCRIVKSFCLYSVHQLQMRYREELYRPLYNPSPARFAGQWAMQFVSFTLRSLFLQIRAERISSLLHPGREANKLHAPLGSKPCWRGVVEWPV